MHQPRPVHIVQVSLRAGQHQTDGLEPIAPRDGSRERIWVREGRLFSQGENGESILLHEVGDGSGVEFRRETGYLLVELRSRIGHPHPHQFALRLPI